MKSRLGVILLVLIMITLLVVAVPFQHAAKRTRFQKTIHDLTVGMLVRVTTEESAGEDAPCHALHVAEIILSEESPGPDQVQGTIESIDLSADRIVVSVPRREGEPRKRTFIVDGDPGIPIGTAPELAQLSDLGAATILLMGGFRGLSVDVLWLRSIALHEQRRYHEERAILDIIIQLQPRYASVWCFQAWNIAYNISVQYDRVEDQFEWIQEGTDFLLKGQKVLPQSADIAFWLGIFYQYKYGWDPEYGRLLEEKTGQNNYELAAEWYDRARKLIEEGRQLSVFHPRVAYSGVYHCCQTRYLQILQQGEMGPDGFDAATLKHAEIWRQRALTEAGTLLQRWPLDAVFPVYAVRVEMTPAEAAVPHAEDTMLKGNLTPEAEHEARQLVDWARAYLTGLSSRFSLDDEQSALQSVRLKVDTVIPYTYLKAAELVIRVQKSSERDQLNLAIERIDRAAKLLEPVQMSEKARTKLNEEIAALRQLGVKSLEKLSPEAPK